MEFVDNILRIFGSSRKQDFSGNVNVVENKKVWEESYFKEYLLALARGEEFLEPISNYPNVIKLNSVFHEMLENQREQTEKGYEKISVISVNLEQRKLYVQVIAAEGGKTKVFAEVKRFQEEKAEKKLGASVHLGGIHLHPHVVNWQYGLSKGKFTYEAAFSAHDLFLLIGPKHYSLTGIVEGEENLFAFRSRESKTNDRLSYLPILKRRDQNFFTKFWCGQMGMNFNKEGRVLSQSGERLNNADFKKVNFEIAKKHDLVLYKGKVGKDLVRVYP